MLLEHGFEPAEVELQVRSLVAGLGEQAQERGQVDGGEVLDDEGGVGDGGPFVDAADQGRVVEAEGHDEGLEVVVLGEGLQRAFRGDAELEVDRVELDFVVEGVDQQAFR